MTAHGAGMSRRGFLGILGVSAAGATALGLSFGPAPGETGEEVTSELPLPESFGIPLPIPPTARAVGVDSSGADLYRITQRAAEIEIIPGTRTSVFGFDGLFPGLTFDTRRGRPIVVRHRNELPVPTAVHLHGGHNPAAHDGFPVDLVLPVGDRSDWTPHSTMRGDVSFGQRDYRYPMAQRAATLWYHDHRMSFTAQAVYRGLVGLHIVRDDIEDALPLPHGDRELPLIITDRAFTADGSFSYPALDKPMRSPAGVERDFMEGVLGDVVLVNGAPWPVHDVDAVHYRLRLLNASNARRYRLALRVSGHPDLPMVQIGSDGGLLARPRIHSTIDIASAERFDVMVDFSKVAVGSEVTMVNRLGTDRTRDVKRFRVVRRSADDSTVPSRLADVERIDPGPAAWRRTFLFTRGDAGEHTAWLINGKTFDPDISLADIMLGDTEVRRFVTNVHHQYTFTSIPFRCYAAEPASRGPSTAD